MQHCRYSLLQPVSVKLTYVGKHSPQRREPTPNLQGHWPSMTSQTAVAPPTEPVTSQSQSIGRKWDEAFIIQNKNYIVF